MLFAQTTVHAQNFGLIKDINTSKDASPANFINDLYLRLDNDFYIHVGYNGKYAVLNNVAYFAADDGLHGMELWRSDGTASGTYMVKDISVGTLSSTVQSITTVGSKIFFTVNQMIYVSDGTDAGTFMVPGVSYTGDQTTCLTAVGNTLYFLTNLSRLWKTDGTLAGTSMIIDFRSTYNYQRDFLGELTNVNGTLFFTTGIDNYTGNELWKSDGTLAGTVVVKDINPGTGSSRPGNFTALNGKLYFSAFDGVGIHLWSSDGTDAATQAVVNTAGVTLPQTDIAPFAIAKNVLFFNAGTAATGSELYTYDPAKSSAGIALVKDISNGSAGSNPLNITGVGDKLVYFSVVNTSGQQELWKSNGTSAGTKLAKAFDAGGNLLSNFTDAGLQLLFTYSSTNTGNELWKSDGTENGTVLIKDIYTGNHSSNISGITYLKDGGILLNANNGITGNELWVTNGSTSGTVTLKNINNTTTASSNPSLYDALAVGNQLYFSAYDPVYGYAPYLTDGTNAGTQLIKDIYAGSSSGPGSFTLFKNNVYFYADSAGIKSIYKTDGTAAGTIKVFNNGKPHSTVTQIVASVKYLYVFYYDNDSNFNELWVSDGTTANSYKVQNLTSAYPNAATISNTVFFVGQDDEHGYELWKATALPGSAKMVKDIYPGTQSSNPNGLLSFKNKLYFGAFDANNNYYLYTSDGTNGGTQVLYSVPLNGGFYAKAILKNKFIFSCYDPVTGAEPYFSDGTTAGTGLLKDINSGTYNSSYPYYFTTVGNTVYFQAGDADHGTELWKTDGTTNGTLAVKDIYPGTFGSYPYNLTAAAGKLYFTATDISGSNVLYVSNGKASGTNPITDAGLTGISVNYLKGTDSKLMISGYNYSYGYELFGGAVTSLAAVAEDKAESIAQTKQLKAFVLGNPVTNNLKISVDINSAQHTQITVADAVGRILINDSRTLSAGNNLLSYTTAAWLPGVYIIKIKTTDAQTALLKVVK